MLQKLVKDLSGIVSNAWLITPANRASWSQVQPEPDVVSGKEIQQMRVPLHLQILAWGTVTGGGVLARDPATRSQSFLSALSKSKLHEPVLIDINQAIPLVPAMILLKTFFQQEFPVST